MDNIQELFGNIDGNDESTDRTIYVRETPSGRKADFEVVEKTNFAAAYPETTRELITKSPLPCGHASSREFPFGGYCQGRKISFPFRKRICNSEYCSRCSVQCPRCAVFASAHCHAREFEGLLFCKRCARILRAQKYLKMISLFVLIPFIERDLREDEQSIHKDITE